MDIVTATENATRTALAILSARLHENKSLSPAVVSKALNAFASGAKQINAAARSSLSYSTSSSNPHSMEIPTPSSILQAFAQSIREANLFPLSSSKPSSSSLSTSESLMLQITLDDYRIGQHNNTNEHSGSVVSDKTDPVNVLNNQSFSKPSQISNFSSNPKLESMYSIFLNVLTYI